jgi:hypothetical protein
MVHSRSDVWTSIGTAMSSALSVYAWLYSIGLVPLFTFITGAFFTLWTQERFENKRRKQEFDRKMTEYVYGPLHQELSSFLKDLIDFQSSMGPTDRISTLTTFVKDYRYGLAKKEIQHGIEELRTRLLPYATLYNEARDITRVFIEQSLDKSKIDHHVSFAILGSEKQQLYITNMLEPIFRDKTPLQFLTEQPIPYMNTSTMVFVNYPPTSVELYTNEHKIEQISKDALEKARKYPVVQKQRLERLLLIEECTLLLEMIRKEITLS